MEPSIKVENLSKQYRIGTARERQDTLRDAIVHGAGRLLTGRPQRAAKDDTFWALKDVSFEVEPGEVLGVIGRNGAGKSTLLKILSRITEPTRGRAILNGRVGSLLEVGTGFHPELTGRENVYLNGAILGMQRKEIERKFDEIVAFSEIEKFIDTPVKRYSSGMYVRLAFAVAAHLEPEILLVDEVLAVGDAAFQKKCIGKMGDVTREGRTVILVSHNMASIEALARDAIILDKGQITFCGNSSHAIISYIKNVNQVDSPIVDLHTSRNILASQKKIFETLHVTDDKNNQQNSFPIGSTILLDIEVFSHDLIKEPHLGIGVTNSRGIRSFTVSTRFQSISLPPIKGKCHIRCELTNIPLTPDQYYLKMTIGDAQSDYDVVEDVLGFEIIPTDYLKSGRLPNSTQGIIVQSANWSIEK